MKLFKSLWVLVTLVLLTFHSLAQDYKQKFTDYHSAGDTLAQFRLLRQWEMAKPKDPELYVCYVNYYAERSKKEMILLEKKPNNSGSFELKDSAGNAAGYLNSEQVYDLDILDSGFRYIDKGIALFPNRLDMRFGKVYMLGQIKDYRRFTDEIVKTIDYSSINANGWLWTDNKLLEAPKNFMLSTIQSYVLQIYNTGYDSLLPYMKTISETVLKYYPDHVESLSDLSIVYMLNNEFDKALVPLLKAEKIAPKDFIVLNNLAHCYNEMKDKKNAIKYYELVEKYGDNEAKQMAQDKLKTLKGK